MKRAMAVGLVGTALAALVAVSLTTGCGSVGYLGQSTRGHLDIVARAKPLPQWIEDEKTPAKLRDRLELAQRMRDFAVRELGLPDNRSYRSYADLGRPYAVWNVVATPELSLKLKTWCFPLFGCAGYRGYFTIANADKLADELRTEGWEAAVYGVPAYSTLGWTDWLGGDPLLNTFIDQPEGELARLIFHELAHQIAYVKDDTVFNESFASAVERIGAARWLAEHGSAAAREQYTLLDARRHDFRQLTRATRAKLEALFESDRSEADKRAGKAALMAQMRADYARLKAERWGGYAGYDAWFTRANNPLLAVQGAYDDLVPAFEALFEREGRDFSRFYAAVKRLAALPKDERRATLAAIAS